jgi:aldehyde dehydrogenase (NAD+)
MRFDADQPLRLLIASAGVREKIAPALAYGNCVVFKPADLVPGSAHALAGIISKSGLPPGVFNLVMGRGSEIGDALLQHPGVAAVSFTGSVATGRKVASAATAATPMKKMQLEMGGKNPLVVLNGPSRANALNSCAIARWRGGLPQARS